VCPRADVCLCVCAASQRVHVLGYLCVHRPKTHERTLALTCLHCTQSRTCTHAHNTDGVVTSQNRSDTPGAHGSVPKGVSYVTSHSDGYGKPPILSAFEDVDQLYMVSMLSYQFSPSTSKLFDLQPGWLFVCVRARACSCGNACVYPRNRAERHLYYTASVSEVPRICHEPLETRPKRFFEVFPNGNVCICPCLRVRVYACVFER
jgi:hypothetical protein